MLTEKNVNSKVTNPNLSNDIWVTYLGFHCLSFRLQVMLNVLLWEILRKFTLRIMWWLVGGGKQLLVVEPSRCISC